MPRWTVQASNDNGQLVIAVEPGEQITLAIESRYSDEPTGFDPNAIEDIRSKLGIATNVSRSTTGGETS